MFLRPGLGRFGATRSLWRERGWGLRTGMRIAARELIGRRPTDWSTKQTGCRTGCQIFIKFMTTTSVSQPIPAQPTPPPAQPSPPPAQPPARASRALPPLQHHGSCPPGQAHDNWGREAVTSVCCTPCLTASPFTLDGTSTTSVYSPSPSPARRPNPPIHSIPHPARWGHWLGKGEMACRAAPGGFAEAGEGAGWRGSEGWRGRGGRKVCDVAVHDGNLPVSGA